MNLTESLLSTAPALSPSLENNFSKEEIQALSDKVNEIRARLVNPDYQATIEEGTIIVAYFRARRGAAFSIKEETPAKAKKSTSTAPKKPRKTTSKEIQQKLSEDILANL